MTATATLFRAPVRPLNDRTVELLERSTMTTGRVNREAGRISGVKVLGLESQNRASAIGMTGPGADRTYSYSPEAMRKAAPLYEGIPVYIDHPDMTTGPGGRKISNRDRKADERFGKLINIRVTESGIFGDLLFLKAHPMAERVCNAAESMPDAFAFSHNAGGKPALRNGRYVIEEICDVRSVDLIGERPGTTNGLFESRQQFQPLRDPAAYAEHLRRESSSFSPLRESADSPFDTPDEFGDVATDELDKAEAATAGPSTEELQAILDSSAGDKGKLKSIQDLIDSYASADAPEEDPAAMPESRRSLFSAPIRESRLPTGEPTRVSKFVQRLRTSA